MPALNTRRELYIWSYLPDWLLTLSLSLSSLLLENVDGFRREFSLTDISIRYPYAVRERVPDPYLYLIAIVTPAILMPLINLKTVSCMQDLHNSLLGLGFALALAGSVTQAVKITVGRPRPDFLSRCQPPFGLIDPSYGLTTSSVCTQTDLYKLKDGFRSFFSGHSSLSFAGLGFLAYYLAGKTHLFDKQRRSGLAYISLAPLMVALMVAISRTMDYRHHWQDVLVGSIVGTLFSYFAYQQYYPPLNSPDSDHPYPPRVVRQSQLTARLSNRVDDYEDGNQRVALLETEAESGPIHH